MKAMILAAGLGSRLKPFTDNHPKALAIVNGKTLLQRNIEYLSRYGINDIVVNVHHFPEQIAELLEKNKDFGSKVTISDESLEVLETGGGLKKAGWFLQDEESPFVLINVDVLTDLNLKAMIEKHNKNKSLVTLAVTNRHTSRYFLFDDLDQLCGWKNTKTGEQKIRREASKFIQRAFSGIHIISPKIFGLMNMDGNFSIVDFYLGLANTQAISAFDHSNSKFIDVGKPESIAKAEGLFK